MIQTITIDGEKYEVDRGVAGAIDQMQIAIETMRSAIVGLASFVDGDPCWCQWQRLCSLIDQRHGVAKMVRGKHLKACLDVKNLPLWQSPSGVNLPWKDSDHPRVKAKKGKP